MTRGVCIASAITNLEIERLLKYLSFRQVEVCSGAGRGSELSWIRSIAAVTVRPALSTRSRGCGSERKTVAGCSRHNTGEVFERLWPRLKHGRCWSKLKYQVDRQRSESVEVFALDLREDVTTCVSIEMPSNIRAQTGIVIYSDTVRLPAFQEGTCGLGRSH